MNSKPCAADDECGEGRCRRGACGPRCMGDGECDSGQVCREGACLKRPECAATADCAQGFVCQSGQCKCTADTSCAVNQACLAGRCGARPPCTADAECAQYGRRCEPTQGVCVPPCVQASDCAPGVDPNLASVLYACQRGSCLLRCVNDTTCGAGFFCSSDGTCSRASCSTFAQCPSGQYCTSAQNGHCVAYQPCQATAACPANNTCGAFTPATCPPGFPCAQTICQELPRCLIDGDCARTSSGPPTFCQDQHCQQTTSCATTASCAAGRICVSGTCVPGGCRGPADCPQSQACVDGRCANPPASASLRAVVISPRSAVLSVGDSLQLTLVAYALDGSSFPLSSASFSVLKEDGSPGTAATVDASGRVTATAPGRIRVRGLVAGTAVAPDEATLTLYAAPGSGRRVVVIDAATRQPLASVAVRGCDAPPDAGPCPAPVDAVTDANGQADFAFTGAAATFSAASSALRPDGRPRYDRVSVVGTGAATVLLPLTVNPVHAAAGFTGSITFRDVHSRGALWLGLASLSSDDPSTTDPQALLGNPFNVTIPQTTQRLAIPGAAVAYLSVGGFPLPLKGTVYGLGEPGRRASVGFAGQFDPAQLNVLGSADLLAYTGGMDYALNAFTTLPRLPLVPDAADLNGNGRCADAQKCPAGTEDVPEYARFPQLGFSPSREQQRRTEVVLPDLPAGLDTAVVAAVEGSAEAGLVPLGFSSRAGGAPNPDGSRPVASLVLRSGAPYGGVEVGLPGIWATAAALTGASATAGNLSARVTRGGTLPARVVVPPFLPVAEGSSYSAASRLFSPGQPQWNALASAGASVGRLVLSGTDSRHVVWFALAGGQASLRVPEPPGGAGTDAAGQPGGLEVTGFELSGGVELDGLLDLQGANLSRLPEWLLGYSRFRGQ